MKSEKREQEKKGKYIENIAEGDGERRRDGES
jgi:hypothetical protein